jgi:hypothetical protein
MSRFGSECTGELDTSILMHFASPQVSNADALVTSFGRLHWSGMNIKFESFDTAVSRDETARREGSKAGVALKGWP